MRANLSKTSLIVALVVILFTMLWVAHANSEPLPTEGEARVGETVSARFVCRDEELLKSILSGDSDKSITESANMAVIVSMCAWSSMPFKVTLLQYMGYTDMNLEPPGRAHIYRVEDPDGGSHYMYMFVERRPV